MQGKFIIDRKLLDHDLWTSEKFTKGQAWIDLIGLANHTDGFIRIRGNKINLVRGDVGWSKLKLAERWKWNRKTVDNFFKELKNDDRIVIKSGNRISTVVSIKNYNLKQSFEQQSIQQNGQQRGNRTDTNKNDKNEKNEKNNTELKEFLDLFNSLFNSKYTITAGRTKKLSLRLKTYTFEQIKKSLENLSTSEWHQGKNDRNWKADPDFLLRSDEQIDKWLNTVSDVKAKPKKVFFLQSELNEMNPVQRDRAIKAMKGNV